MKFKHFFIIILVIQLFILVSRMMKQGNYFSISQEITFEKSEAKSSKRDFQNPQKMLVYYNSNSVQSKDILQNVQEAFKFTKINYTVKDIGEIEDTASYDTFIFATDTFIGFSREMYVRIKKEVEEGKNVVFLNGTPYNPFNSLAGIESVSSVKESSKGIVFSEKLFPGIDEYEPTDEIITHTVMELKLMPDVRIFARSDENIPILWERKAGKGRILYSNVTFFSDRVTRGTLNQWIAYANDWYIMPTLNAKLVHIDDFPAPIPRTTDGSLKKFYNMNTKTFLNQVWWADMKSMAKENNVIYTGFIIIDYNNIVEKEKMKRISDANVRDLNIEGRELFLNKGELGIHGYNHNPLVQDGIDFKGLNYVPWRSKDDMAAGITELKNYVREIFGKKVKLYTYVAPSNIIDKEGVGVIVKNYPDLKTLSGLFYGNGDTGVYLQEIGRNSDYPTLYNLPRFSSGFYRDNNEMYSLYNALAVYGYFSHFVHPDDVISTDRSRGKNWEELKNEFSSIIKDVNEKFPYLQPMRSSDMTKKYINIEDLEIKSEKIGDEIYIGSNNFRNPYETFVRVRGKNIKNISSGTFKKVYEAGESKVYLVTIDKEDVIIYLGN